MKFDDMNKIKWGIIGAGKIARKFASDFKNSKYGELKAIASTSAERSMAFAREFNIYNSYDNYNELFNDQQIDAVYIATPNSLHFNNSMEAMKKGKAVLCEKPLTCDPEHTIELISFAEENGVYLMEGMWTWFLPAIRKAKEWIDSGLIGNLTHIKADFGFKPDYDPGSRLFNPELGGGSMLDIGIYPVALSRYLLKTEPTSIDSRIIKAPTGVDKDVAATMVYEDVFVQIGSSFRSELQNSACIVGTKGYISIPAFWKTDRCFLCKRDVIIEEFSDERSSFGFNYEIDAVSKDLLKGKKIPGYYKHEDSLAISKLMNKIIHA